VATIKLGEYNVGEKKKKIGTYPSTKEVRCQPVFDISWEFF
jgi:hypothetical protein